MTTIKIKRKDGSIQILRPTDKFRQDRDGNKLSRKDTKTIAFEIATDIELRDKYNLKDGDQVEIELDA